MNYGYETWIKTYIIFQKIYTHVYIYMYIYIYIYIYTRTWVFEATKYDWCFKHHLHNLLSLVTCSQWSDSVIKKKCIRGCQKCVLDASIQVKMNITWCKWCNILYWGVLRVLNELTSIYFLHLFASKRAGCGYASALKKKHQTMLSVAIGQTLP